MEDGEVALLSPLGVELYDAGGVRQQRMPTQLSGVDHVADKREFRHFMLKEIHEQPETAELWVARHLPQGLATEQPVALPMDDAFYAGIERIQILACGTSRPAAMVGAYLLEQFAGIPTSVYYASEFRYAPPPLAPIPSPLVSPSPVKRQTPWPPWPWRRSGVWPMGIRPLPPANWG